MKYIFCLFLGFALTIQVQSKNKKILTLDDHPANNHFSFELGIGGGKGFTTIDTGFEVDNGSIVTFFPGGGGLFRASGNFFRGERWTFGLDLTYLIGGLNNEYENGTGDNVSNILTPTIRYAPILFNKGKINLGLGYNYVFSNYLEITAKLPNTTQSARYNFKKSSGPSIMIEYQEHFNKWSGARVGLNTTYMNYKLSSIIFNNIEINKNAAPLDMMEHSSISLGLYLGIYVFL